MFSRKDVTNGVCELSVTFSKRCFLKLWKNQTSGVYAAIAAFLMFSMIQFRDGPFVRPHPAFWRAVLGVNLLYELGLVFLLFQDLQTARKMMLYIDPNLGVPLPEKSYAEDCTLTVRNLWVGLLYLLSAV